jgi:serine/threonine protein kinase
MTQQSGPFGRQDPSLPQVFGRYLLVQRLSRGGMGEIFLAKHGLAGFEKLAVIKKVLPHLAADEQFISRFVDEAQVAIKLQHVNVAQVFEVGRVGDEYFLALEYVEGRDLRRTLGLLGHRKQRLPVDLALFIGRELANGLAYAHRRTGTDGSSLNLVHCDISPPNVLVSFEGETKVIDFGIAKSALRGTVTDPKMGFGKFGYMAPEQLIRGGIVDHRTDIYAAGVVLYELITGQRLYEAGPEPDYRALAKKVARGDHPVPSQIAPDLALYDDLVSTALRPKPEERYQSAAEFRDAIQQALVAVNPTISTDQLGAFMRDLFSEEMTAQRELHERVASAHLADFQEAFHTQTISTVSFAMSQLGLAGSGSALPAVDPPNDLVSRPATPRATPRPRNSSRQPVSKPASIPPSAPRSIPPSATPSIPGSRPSPALDTMAPPTSAMAPPDDLDLLADGTGTAVREAPFQRKARWPWVLGAAIVLVGVGVVFAMRGGLGDSKPPETKLAATTNAPGDGSGKAMQNPNVTVEPIDTAANATNAPMPPPSPGKASSEEIQMPSDVMKHPPRPPHSGGRIAKPPHEDKTPKVDASKKPDAVTRDAVTNKWMQTTREYNEYKTHNSNSLEGDFSDLAIFVQTHLKKDQDLADTLRRIEAFRAKIRE